MSTAKSVSAFSQGPVRASGVKTMPLVHRPTATFVLAAVLCVCAPALVSFAEDSKWNLLSRTDILAKNSYNGFKLGDAVERVEEALTMHQHELDGAETNGSVCVREYEIQHSVTGEGNLHLLLTFFNDRLAMLSEKVFFFAHAEKDKLQQQYALTLEAYKAALGPGEICLEAQDRRVTRWLTEPPDSTAILVEINTTGLSGFVDTTVASMELMDAMQSAAEQ